MTWSARVRRCALGIEARRVLRPSLELRERLAFGGATLVVVISQAAGMDFLVASQAWLETTFGQQLL